MSRHRGHDWRWKRDLRHRRVLTKALKRQGQGDSGKHQGQMRKLFVLVSRPYNGCDEGVSLQLPKKFADAGVEIMPMDMLDFKEARLSDENFTARFTGHTGKRFAGGGDNQAGQSAIRGVSVKFQLRA